MLTLGSGVVRQASNLTVTDLIGPFRGPGFGGGVHQQRELKQRRAVMDTWGGELAVNSVSNVGGQSTKSLESRGCCAQCLRAGVHSE